MEFELKNFNRIYINKFVNYYLILLFINVILQVSLISSDYENIYIVLLIFLISLVTIKILTNEKYLKKYTIPIIIILISNFGYLSGPLLLKTIFFQKVNGNLDYPIETFNLIFEFQFLLLISFLFFIFISNRFSFIKKFISVNLLIFKNIKYNYFKLIFFFVVFLKFYIWVGLKGVFEIAQFGNIYFKFLIGLEIFYYLPLLIYLKSFFFDKSLKKKNLILLLLFYLFSTIFFAIISNTRAVLFEYILTLILFLFIFFLFNKITIKNKLVFFLSFLIFYFFISIFNNMIISVRDIKMEISPLELFKLSLQSRDQDIYKNYWSFEEKYTNNITIDRLIFPKYVDKSIKRSINFQDFQEEQFKSFIKKKIISTLPLNIIYLFDKNFNKEEYALSSGSYLDRLNGIMIGNFNQGSNIVDLKILFGKYAKFLIIGIYIFIFYCVQIFQESTEHKTRISFLILLLAVPITRITVEDSVVAYFSFFRTLLELLFFYFLIFKFTNFFKKKSFRDSI